MISPLANFLSALTETITVVEIKEDNALLTSPETLLYVKPYVRSKLCRWDSGSGSSRSLRESRAPIQEHRSCIVASDMTPRKPVRRSDPVDLLGKTYTKGNESPHRRISLESNDAVDDNSKVVATARCA
jgi:hypothetical protein